MHLKDFRKILGWEPCNEAGYPEAMGTCVLVVGVSENGKTVSAVFDAPDLESVGAKQGAFLVF